MTVSCNAEFSEIPLSLVDRMSGNQFFQCIINHADHELMIAPTCDVMDRVASFPFSILILRL